MFLFNRVGSQITLLSLMTIAQRSLTTASSITSMRSSSVVNRQLKSNSSNALVHKRLLAIKSTESENGALNGQATKLGESLEQNRTVTPEVSENSKKTILEEKQPFKLKKTFLSPVFNFMSQCLTQSGRLHRKLKLSRNSISTIFFKQTFEENTYEEKQRIMDAAIQIYTKNTSTSAGFKRDIIVALIAALSSSAYVKHIIKEAEQPLDLDKESKGIKQLGENVDEHKLKVEEAKEKIKIKEGDIITIKNNLASYATQEKRLLEELKEAERNSAWTVLGGLAGALYPPAFLFFLLTPAAEQEVGKKKGELEALQKQINGIRKNLEEAQAMRKQLEEEISGSEASKVESKSSSLNTPKP